jgi:hypothetical protein
VSGISPGRGLVGAAVAASVALVVIYLVLGGGTYEPTPVADPCAAREWREPEGIEESAQQFALSALDGAACELGVSRETLAPALATEESRAEFAAELGISDAELEAAVRAGVLRGIDDAAAAGAISPLVADGLRAVASRLPVDESIAVIEDAGEFLEGADGVIDDVGDLLGDAGELLP